ncbi:MAG: DUF4258 domain-containing protein [Candidatus Diapherotrites archaeon]
MSYYFEVISVLGKRIYTTEFYWQLISRFKHPIIKDYEEEVKETLRNADEIRQSKTDSSVHLYYKKFGKYFLCVLIKNLNDEGFIVTAYLSNNVKKGEIIWKKKF